MCCCCMIFIHFIYFSPPVRKKPGQIRNPHCRYIINIHKKYSTPETNKQILLDKL